VSWRSASATVQAITTDASGDVVFKVQVNSNPGGWAPHFTGLFVLLSP
jgi:hypothetical protein